MTNRPGDVPPEIELGPFVRGVAHEVANPLNAVLMNVGLAKMLYDRGDVARVGEVLERLSGDCSRFEKMLRGLQRFGAGLRAPQRDTVAAATLFGNAMELLAAPKPVLRVDAGEVSVHADNRALERAIAGILQNSVEAGARTIEATARDDGDDIVLTIADDGEGIAASSRQRVVEPFYSTRHSAGSAGLGLTLAREVLRVHGGTLAIAANEPRGVRVTLRLPNGVATPT